MHDDHLAGLLADLQAEAQVRGLSVEAGFDPCLSVIGDGRSHTQLLWSNLAVASAPMRQQLAPESAGHCIVCRNGSFFAASCDAELRRQAFDQLERAPEQNWLRVDRLAAGGFAASNAVDVRALYGDSPAEGRRLLQAVLEVCFPTTAGAAFLQPKHSASPAAGVVSALNETHGRAYRKTLFYRPVALDIEVTHRCTLECPECAILPEVRAAAPGLPLPQLTEALAQAVTLGMYCYSFTGGEPFLRFDDLLALIRSAPTMECFKIQTNATFFISDEKCARMLERLKDYGFGKAEQHLHSTVQCSAGIQNYAGGAPESRLLNWARALAPHAASTGRLAFGAIVTAPDFADARDLLWRWQRVIAAESGIRWGLDRAHVRVVPIDYAEHHQAAADNEKIPLREHLADLMRDWGSCFHSDSTPWPRLLLRADGSLYACSCFGHVFGLGRFPQTTLREAVERANAIPEFAAIHERGLLGLFDSIERASGSQLGDTLVPRTMTVCQMCGVINGRRAMPVRIGRAAETRTAGGELPDPPGREGHKRH